MHSPNDTEKKCDTGDQLNADQNESSNEESSTSEAGAAIGAGVLAASLGFGPVGTLIGALVGYGIAQGGKEEMNFDFLTPEGVRRVAGACAVIVSFAIWFWNHRNQRETQVADLLVAGATGAAIPNTLLMVLAIDDPTIYSKFTGLTTLGAIGGIAILHTSYKGLKKYFVPLKHSTQTQVLDQ